MMERIRKMSLKELQALEKLIVEERETRIENELSGICAQAISNIDSLLSCCNKLSRHRLGTIEIECVDCDCAIDVDILSDGILEDIRRVLMGYIKEE
jgi:hypothetical protein